MKPRTRTQRRRGGFSLTELSVASSLMVVAGTMALAGLVHAVRSTRQSTTKDELDMDVQTAMERVKSDIRLSSMDEMHFYPDGVGPYTAISFPLAGDGNGDGALDVDGEGKVIWAKTLVYHVWRTEPHQLRLTEFDPRDNTLSDAERQQQLISVVGNGNGLLTHNAANTQTHVVFENLFEWEITPKGSLYDGYAEELMRDPDANLGYCVLAPGSHTFAFEVVGKNPVSDGHKVGLDTLRISASAGPREAEAQLPAQEQSGATAVEEYMAGGSWDGNYQLKFDAGEPGQYFTLQMDNDRWEETNFKGIGHACEDTLINFEQNLDPKDFVVKLQGNRVNWLASTQTGDPVGASASADAFRGCAVRVLIRGEEMIDGDSIENNGAKVKVRFKAGDSGTNLRILAAYIAECAETEVPSMDAVPGTQMLFAFSGSHGYTLPGGTTKYTGRKDFDIHRNKSYLVTYLIADEPGMGTPWIWNNVAATNAAGCYIVRPGAMGGSAAGDDGNGDGTWTGYNEAMAMFANPTWSYSTNVVALPAILGVDCTHTLYAWNGTYTSPICDTTVSVPEYDRIDWTADVPQGGLLEMKVRTADSNDMSDAPAWSNAFTTATAGLLQVQRKRYIQFQTQLNASGDAAATPVLKDVTVKWTGPTRVVNVGGTFTKGPDYGVFKLRVDGQELKRAMDVRLKIFKKAAARRGERMVTSELTAEIKPRNTGS